MVIEGDFLKHLHQAPTNVTELEAGQYGGLKALMRAVLENGIASYLAESSGRRNEAEAWIMSRPRDYPFSFTVVCETLGLDPGAMRVALQRWRSAQLSARQAVGRTRPNVRRAHYLQGPTRHFNHKNRRH